MSSSGFRAHARRPSPPPPVVNHYQVLQVSEDDSYEKINKVFRKLTLKYHPDKNPSEEARVQFEKIKLAHEILSDPDKRSELDFELLRKKFENINIIRKLSVRRTLKDINEGLVRLPSDFTLMPCPFCRTDEPNQTCIECEQKKSITFYHPQQLFIPVGYSERVWYMEVFRKPIQEQTKLDIEENNTSERYGFIFVFEFGNYEKQEDNYLFNPYLKALVYNKSIHLDYTTIGQPFQHKVPHPYDSTQSWLLKSPPSVFMKEKDFPYKYVSNTFEIYVENEGICRYKDAHQRGSVSFICHYQFPKELSLTSSSSSSSSSSQKTTSQELKQEQEQEQDQDQETQTQPNNIISDDSVVVMQTSAKDSSNFSTKGHGSDDEDEDNATENKMKQQPFAGAMPGMPGMPGMPFIPFMPGMPGMNMPGIQINFGAPNGGGQHAGQPDPPLKTQECHIQ